MKESSRLDDVERVKLEEILELCADYERQIEAEQREGLERRQRQLQDALASKKAEEEEVEMQQSAKLVLSELHNQRNSSEVGERKKNEDDSEQSSFGVGGVNISAEQSAFGVSGVNIAPASYPLTPNR